MSAVLDALAVRKRAVGVLRSTLQRGVDTAVLASTATVTMTVAASQRLLRIGADMPSDAVSMPPAEAWPWAKRPVLFVHETPLEFEFRITSEGGVNMPQRRVEYTHTLPVLAHWVVPPGTLPITAFAGYSRTDLMMMPTERREFLITLGRCVAIHPDFGTTSGPLAWGVQVDGFERGMTTSNAFVQALARAPMTRTLIRQQPTMSRPDRRAMERAGMTVEILDVPRIGSTLPSDVPARSRYWRQHHTAYGEVKVALTPQRVREIEAETGGRLTGYTCTICHGLHVGNQRTDRVGMAVAS